MALSVPPKANCVRNVLHDLPGKLCRTPRRFRGFVMFMGRFGACRYYRSRFSPDPPPLNAAMGTRLASTQLSQIFGVKFLSSLWACCLDRQSACPR